jgi:hypothetical protein
MTPALMVAALLASPLRASEFLEDLHRAESREARDPERVEFATRAIHAWKPADGSQLLADAYYRRGEGEYQGWDDLRVADDMTKALGLDPRNDRALLLRARARLRGGDAPASEKDFGDFTRERPDDGEGWLGLAEARVARGLPRADRPALEASTKAARLLDAGDPRPAIAAGRAHLAAGRPMKALNSFETAAASPGELLAESLSWRARAKASLGDPRGARDDEGKAAEEFEKRIEGLDRANAPRPAVASARSWTADARFRRGLSEEKLDLPSEALEDYRLACALGHAAACARVQALTPAAVAPAPKPKKLRRVPNPSDDSGTRIYAN